jgi:hypothetical protein
MVAAKLRTEVGVKVTVMEQWVLTARVAPHVGGLSEGGGIGANHGDAGDVERGGARIRHGYRLRRASGINDLIRSLQLCRPQGFDHWRYHNRRRKPRPFQLHRRRRARQERNHQLLLRTHSGCCRKHLYRRRPEQRRPPRRCYIRHHHHGRRKSLRHRSQQQQRHSSHRGHPQLPGECRHRCLRFSGDRGPQLAHPRSRSQRRA